MNDPEVRMLKHLCDQGVEFPLSKGIALFELAKEVSIRLMSASMVEKLVGPALAKYFDTAKALSEAVNRDSTHANVLRNILGVLSKLLGDYLSMPQPIAKSRFFWVKDDGLRNILDDDYAEARRCLQFGNFKACVVLCGSILEAALYDLLRRDQAWTMDTSRKTRPQRRGGKCPQIQSDEIAESWKLSELIAFAKDNDVLKPELIKHLDVALRDSRNLIHPTARLRSSLTNANLAKISAAALDLALEGIQSAKMPPSP